MSYFVYIIYSESIGKYYIGSSEDTERRLEAHNSGISVYTRRARDWKIIYIEELPTKKEALILERKIKKRGAKRFLDGLNFSGGVPPGRDR